MRRLTPRSVLLASAVASLAVFCAVQDRVVAAGVGRYLDMKRQALAGRGPDVSVDEVLQPAVRDSVRRGLLWGGGVLMAGCGLAFAVRRGAPR